MNANHSSCARIVPAALLLLLTAVLVHAQTPAPAAAPLYQETWRPQFHFSPQTAWLNDPNGLVFYNGTYHLCFQHNPTSNEMNGGVVGWGHATSPDLVHWTQHDDILRPDENGPAWSGSAVVDWNNTAGLQTGTDKTLVAMYCAAGKPFTQCLAYSTDAGATWQHYAKNPVLLNQATGNRDPKVVWYPPDKKWIAVIYKQYHVFGFFSSPDLKEWTHLSDIDVGDCAECPDFFPMNIDGDPARQKWVFTGANGRYLIGDFDGKRFTAEVGPYSLDRGRNFYAVQTFSDIPKEDGRRIQIAWMAGGRYPGMPFNQQMSFPCEIKLRTLTEGLRLCRQPVKEIELLHGPEQSFPAQDLVPGTNPLAGVQGELFDIKAEIDPGSATEIGFKIRGEEIRYTVKDKWLRIPGAVAEPFPQLPSGPLKLRILVDRTSIEILANEGRIGMSSCFLPDAANKSLEVYALGGTAKIVSLKVYPLNSAWNVTTAAK